MTESLIRFDRAELGYGKRTILRDVNCSIHPGDCVGIVGPNGSGKTTFLRGVLGLLKPTGGVVAIDKKKRFAYVPQVEDLNYYWPVTVREAVALPAASRRLFGRVSAEEGKNIDSSIEKTGISNISGLLLSEASGGQRQKAILAQALCQKPDVLLLDEPTKGLDVVAERDFMALIRDLRKEEKLTILLVTHTLQIPLNFTEKIFLFKEGRVFGTTPDELVKTKKLEDIYGVPFLHDEKDGFRWVSPREGRL
jgi:zinc transport system ATP-binding protein